MRARQLEVFRTVMRCGTLTEAARQLHVSQPALSQVLLHAEDELGFRLFDRVKGRLVPTPEAEELFPEAERIFGDIENLRRNAAALRAGRGGTVRLAASAPPALALVPAALDAFRRANPAVRVRSSVVPLERIVAMLDSGEAGLGIAVTDEGFPLVATEVIGQCRVALLVPDGHRLAGRAEAAGADLAGERLIGYRADTQPARLLAAALGEDGDGPLYRPEIEVELSIIALAFVQDGLGVALVDDLLPWHRFAGVRAVPFTPRADLPEVTLPVSLLTSRRRPLSRHHEALRTELRRAVEARGNA